MGFDGVVVSHDAVVVGVEGRSGICHLWLHVLSLLLGMLQILRHRVCALS